MLAKNKCIILRLNNELREKALEINTYVHIYLKANNLAKTDVILQCHS